MNDTGFHSIRMIITGGLQSGKSSLAAKLATELKGKGIPIAGIIAKGHWKNNVRSGFTLLDLATGREAPLAERRRPDVPAGNTAFRFFQSGIAFGRDALISPGCSGARVIFVDEIGKLEARGEGWAPFLDPILHMPACSHVWVVRETLIDLVISTWPFTPTAIIRCDQPDAFPAVMKAILGGKQA